MQNMFGTKSTTVLTKLTAVCAIGFIITCVSLAVISSHKAKSIVDNIKIPQQQATAVPEARVPAPLEPTAPQGGANEVQ